MAPEEETQKCSNSNSNGGSGSYGVSLRSSKKQKKKKVPQRGLGVAQLEKIRLEEQQKKDGSTILPPSLSISSPTRHNSSFPLSVPDYQTFFSVIPHTSDLSSSPNSHCTFPLATSVGWQSGGPKMWSSCDYNLGLRDSCVDDGLAFQSGISFPYESRPIWPLPSLMQKAQQYQQPPPLSPSMVNGSSGISSSSLSNYRIEPPSNQSCYSDSIAPPWPEEEKMGGMKRPYPFSLDNPLGQSFHYNSNFPPVIQPKSRLDESTLFNNRGSFSIQPVASFREVPCFNANSGKKNLKDNGINNGDFLTLAPPTILSCQNSKFRRSSGYLPFDFESLPYQGIMENSIIHLGPTVPSHQQAYYSFLLATIMQKGQATKAINNSNGCHDVGENIDLNLKL